MPLYEYQCECGKHLEKFRSMDNRYNVTCPDCGRTPKLLVSLPRAHTTLTAFSIVDADGKVLTERRNCPRTPMFSEYYPKEVLQEAREGGA